MRKLIIFVLLVGLAAVGYGLGMGVMKRRLVNALSEAAQRPVRIKSLSLTLPLGARITGLTVPPIGREKAAPISAEEIRARLAFDGVARGKTVLDLEVTAPSLSMVWNAEARRLLSMFQAAGGFAGQGAGASAQGGQMPTLWRLRVRDGELLVADETVIPRVVWRLTNLGVSLKRGGGGSARQYVYSAAGLLKGAENKELGRFEVDGSLTPGGPGEAKLSLGYDRLKTLAPYVRKVLGTAPDQGKVELESRVTFDHERGLIIAENELTAAGVRFPLEEPTKLGPTGNRLVELLSDPQGRVHLSFVVTGRAGEPLDWSDLAAGALREAMRQALARSIRKVLIETEKAAPIEELLREGLKSIGR